MYKDSSNFREDFPGGYTRNGSVYDASGKEVGYVTGDGDKRITESGAFEGQLYRNKQKGGIKMGAALIGSAAIYALASFARMWLGC